MTMIGEATKCHLFLIDNLDRLDTEYLNALLSLLEEDKKIEQVFLGGVDHADVDKTMEAIKAAGDTPYIVGHMEAGEKGVTLC